MADEHRYGLISVLRRGWTLRGAPPHCALPHALPMGLSLLRTLEVAGDGLAVAMFADGVSLDMHHAVLRQISTRDPEAVHVIIWDQAGCRQNTDTSLDQLPSNVRIISLLPYSPELNPLEKLGNLIQDRFGNSTVGQERVSVYVE